MTRFPENIGLYAQDLTRDLSFAGGVWHNQKRRPGSDPGTAFDLIDCRVGALTLTETDTRNRNLSEAASTRK
jgi:hypothetical protein